MMLAIFGLVVGFFVVYAVSPFFEKAYRNKKLFTGSSEQENLVYRKEEILAALSDLEYDFKLKKMTEADYLQLKERLTRDAVEVMKKLGQVDEKAIKHAVRVAARKPKPQRVGS